MASDLTITVHKNSVDDKIGLRLEDRKPDGLPKIVQISPGGAAAACGQLKKGDVLLSVNGMDVRGHKRAAEVLKEATGDIALLVRRNSSRSSFFSRKRTKSSNQAVTEPAAAVPAEPEAPAEAAPEDAAESYDVDAEAKAAIKMQAASRGRLARSHLEAEKATAPVTEVAAKPESMEATVDEEKKEEKPKPAKKEGSGFKLGIPGMKKKKAEEAWTDTYTVTLTRGEDTYKLVNGEKVPVRASLGMKIVQFSVDSPPIISEIYPDQPAALTGVIRKGDTILTVNGIDMKDPNQGITALAEASSVEIKAQRGTDEIAAAATKLQAVYRGDKARKGGAEATAAAPAPSSWWACCASPRKPKTAM